MWKILPDLVFDTKLPVVPQYEHIFDDEENVQRLPSAVRESGMRVQLFEGALRRPDGYWSQTTRLPFLSIITIPFSF